MDDGGKHVAIFNDDEVSSAALADGPRFFPSFAESWQELVAGITNQYIRRNAGIWKQSQIF